jgi:PAS domain S-box-containing protein
MNYENKSKPELIEEIRNLNKKISDFQSSCKQCELNSLSTSMQIIRQIRGHLPVVTYTLDLKGNFIFHEGDFSEYFADENQEKHNFIDEFPNYSDKLKDIDQESNIEFDVKINFGFSKKIWRHCMQLDEKSNQIVGYAIDITTHLKLIDDLEHKEEELSEQEYILEEAKKLVTFGEWQYDIESDQLYFSDIIFDLFHIDKSKFDYKLESFVKLVYKKDRQKVLRKLMKSRDKHVPFDFECRTVLNGKPKHYIHAMGRVITNNQNQATKMIGAVQDITYQKMNEKIISDSEAHFRLMTENLTDMISKHDPEGNYTYVSPSCKQVIGYDQHELIGKNAYEFFYKEDLDNIQNSHSEVLDTPDIVTVRYRIRTKSEGFIWVETSNKTIRDEHTNEVLEIICVTRNISERKQFQLQLERQNMLIRNMLEAVDEGIVVFNQDILTSYNPKFLRMWDMELFDIDGMFEEDLFGMLADFVLNEDEFYSRIEEMIKSEETIYNNVLHLKNKKVFDITTKKKVSNGVTYGRIWLFRDITEQTKANDKLLWYTQDLEFAKYDLEMKEQELRKTVKELKIAKRSAEEATMAKSMFLANMSHEIRTPMNAILGFSELILEGNLNQKEKLYTTNILNAGKNLLNLINDILDLSKIEAGKIVLSYEFLNLQKFLEEIQNIFSFKTNEKGVDLRISYPDEMPKSIYLDETRLRQIMFNLVGNAVKFTDKGAIEVKVEVDYLDNEDHQIDLALSVIDSGIGIPEDQFDNIFESFRQREGQSTRKYGGTGLGLSISKRLTEMMNGFMTLKSTEGVGSAFTVNLHKVTYGEDALEPTIQSDEDMIENIVFDPAKILVVDDVQDNRDVAVGVLERFDFEVNEADNGKEAIEKVSKYKPNLVLMDIKMPVMDGIEATRILKANDATKDIPIIAFTASVMKDNLKEIEEICDDVLHKPLERQKLFEKLKNYLDYSMKQEEEFEIVLEEEQALEMTSSDYVEFKSRASDWNERYHLLIESYIIDEIEEFAAEIKEYCDGRGISQLESFADELLAACSSFDIEKMEKDLNRFPDLINSIIENIIEN